MEYVIVIFGVKLHVKSSCSKLTIWTLLMGSWDSLCNVNGNCACFCRSLMIFEILVEITHHIFCKNFLTKKCIFLQKCYQNLVRNVRHCNNFAKFAILVQTCKILVSNAKLTRISEEFCKICDSCNLVSRDTVKAILWNPITYT